MLGSVKFLKDTGGEPRCISDVRFLLAVCCLHQWWSFLTRNEWAAELALSSTVLVVWVTYWTLRPINSNWFLLVVSVSVIHQIPQKVITYIVLLYTFIWILRYLNSCWSGWPVSLVLVGKLWKQWLKHSSLIFSKAIKNWADLTKMEDTVFGECNSVCNHGNCNPWYCWKIVTWNTKLQLSIIKQKAFVFILNCQINVEMCEDYGIFWNSTPCNKSSFMPMFGLKILVECCTVM